MTKQGIFLFIVIAGSKEKCKDIFYFMKSGRDSMAL